MQHHRRLVGIGVLCVVWLGISSQPVVSHAQGTSPNEGIVGCILATQENRVSVGEGDTVVIDQGTARGVQAGDRFVILDETSVLIHPVTKKRIRPPRQVIGEVAVVHVQERAATAVVIKSHREIGVGAIIVGVTSL